MADWRFWGLSVVYPADRVIAAEQVARFTSGEQSEVEYRITRADGEIIWVRDSVKTQRNDDSSFIVYGVVGNITQRKRLEEQLLQAQKMEAIGRLAGGIAHDFNNLLVVIIGYSELLLQHSVSSSDPWRKNLAEIKKAGERATLLTHQLFAFSRQQVLQSKIVDLNLIVAETDKMLQRLIGEDIELVALLGSGLGRVRADPGQMEQVIVNLAVNARDAMPHGGRLTIETANVLLDETYTRQHVGVTPGRYVMLAVSDTGSGIDSETLSHIFEPFFTTKAPDKGTGLGLAIVYGIVKQSGGHITVTSQVGSGTTFKIYLPRLRATVELNESSPAPISLREGVETVMVVEDDASVRELACSVLKENGYTVLQAGQGDEALRVSQEYSGPIHLLLTDMVMPRMRGYELAERLKSWRSDLKVLYMSGYTDNTTFHLGNLEANAAFLQKPFSPDALTRKVREVLEGG